MRGSLSSTPSSLTRFHGTSVLFAMAMALVITFEICSHICTEQATVEEPGRCRKTACLIFPP